MCWEWKVNKMENEKMTLVNERLDGLSRLVGNTPLVGIRLTFRGKRRVIYAKCEQLNLTGSIKDRMALHILKVRTPTVLYALGSELPRRPAAIQESPLPRSDARWGIR